MPVAKVQLPDGRVAKFEVAAGTTQAQVEAEARKMFPQIVPNGAPRPLPAEKRLFTEQLIPNVPGSTVSTVGARPDRDAFHAALRSASSRAIENVLGVPDLVIAAGGRLLHGEPLIEPQFLRDRKIESLMQDRPDLTREQAVALLDQFSPPQLGDKIIPRPSGANVVAGLETAAQVPGAVLDDQPLNLGERFNAQQASDLAAAQEHPVATTVGGALGDAATIATGRIPARGLARAAMPAVKAPRVARSVKPGFKAALDTSARKLSDTVGRGAVRAGEAGLEGATLALLQEGDPLQTAAFAAGAQAAGSLIITATQSVRKRPLSSTFMALLLGHQLFRAVGPGQKNLFESSDQAINEIIAGYGLGVLATAAGMRRVPRKGFAANFPEAVTDSLTAIPRGALTSMWEDLASDKGETLAPVIEKYTSGGFNENQRRRIERAFKSGKLASEIEKMMAVPSFREALDE